MLLKRSRHVNERPPSKEGSAQGRWVYGINTVLQRLETDPSLVIELAVTRGESPRISRITELARKHRLSLRVLDDESLAALVGSSRHQGCAARTKPFVYADLAEVVAAHEGPVLVLDQIQDPHNLGALIRTAAAAGMTCAVVPRDGAVPVTAAVEKVASGAASTLPICQVGNISRTLVDLRDRGFWSYGLATRDGVDLYETKFDPRAVIVLGGEQGMRPLVQKSCDFLVTIPMSSRVESLNASVAGAVVMYELLRQRRAQPG